jgi:hypothetical protein
MPRRKVLYCELVNANGISCVSLARRFVTRAIGFRARRLNQN